MERESQNLDISKKIQEVKEFVPTDEEMNTLRKFSKLAIEMVDNRIEILKKGPSNLLGDNLGPGSMRDKILKLAREKGVKVNLSEKAAEDVFSKFGETMETIGEEYRKEKIALMNLQTKLAGLRILIEEL